MRFVVLYGKPLENEYRSTSKVYNGKPKWYDNGKIKPFHQNKSSFYWKFHFYWLCFSPPNGCSLFFNSSPSLPFANSFNCVFTATSYECRLDFSLSCKVCFCSMFVTALKIWLNQKNLPKKLHSHELFEKCDLFHGKISLHDFCAMSSWATNASYLLHGTSFIKSHCDKHITILHRMCNVLVHTKWNGCNRRLCVANLVCSIDFFSAHRLHSLRLQYHLHFNARLESFQV